MARRMWSSFPRVRMAMQTCWCFRLSDEELVLAKRVDTFVQRPRGAVPLSANDLDALGHLLHTRGVAARRLSLPAA
jgi:hypothetical protein